MMEHNFYVLTGILLVGGAVLMSIGLGGMLRWAVEQKLYSKESAASVALGVGMMTAGFMLPLARLEFATSALSFLVAVGSALATGLAVYAILTLYRR